MTRKIKIFICMFCCIFLLACATTGGQSSTERKIITYEEVGIAIATARNILASYEAQGILKGNDLLNAKSLYAQARQAYIEAGDDMVAMIQTTDANQQILQRQLYAKALAKASRLAIQLSAIFQAK